MDSESRERCKASEKEEKPHTKAAQKLDITAPRQHHASATPYTVCGEQHATLLLTITCPSRPDAPLQKAGFCNGLLEDVKTVIARLADSEPTMPEVVECLENVLSAEPNALVIPKDFTYGRIAFNKFIQGQVYEVQLEVFWIVPGI